MNPNAHQDFFMNHLPLAQAQPGGLASSLPMFIAIGLIFYFLLLRPQMKEQKEHQALLSSLQKGDKVVTGSGVHGKVWEVRDVEVVLEVADKIRVTIDKLSIKRKKSGES